MICTTQRPTRLIAAPVMVAALLAATAAAAQSEPPPSSSPGSMGQVSGGGEPSGYCDPPCRRGYFCRNGRCLSNCNPPCGAGERCVNGDCVHVALVVDKPAERAIRNNYFGVAGGYRVGMNTGSRSAGEIRAEFGSKYGAFQLGPLFGSDVTSLRAAFLGQVPWQPSARLPLFLIPSLALGFSYSWIDDTAGTQRQQFHMTPAVRLRYHLGSRFAWVVDPVQVEINFLTLRSTDTASTSREKITPVLWSFTTGIVALY